MTDTDLASYVKQAQNGNAEAFGKLYAGIGTELYRFALWYLKDSHDAEDCVQEACIKAYQSIRSLKKSQAFKAWFMQILANCCKDHLEAASRLTLVSDEDPVLADAPYYASFSDGSVERYLDRLSETDRRIVLLSVLGGYKSPEIGKALHMSGTAVRSRLSRALHFLRNEMEADQ